MTSIEQVRAWLSEPEGTRLEFKEAKTSYQFDKLVEYCVALANEGGGKILLGVTDKRPRRIVGTAAFSEPGRTEAGLHDRLAHRIPIEEVRTPEGRVLVVHVPARLPGTAWQIGGRYLKRAGDELTALREAELRAMFAETGPDFSAQVCAGSSVADLAPSAIATFRDRWSRRTGDARRLSWTDERTLADAELSVDGVPTYAALILFGTRAALGRHLAQAEVVFEYRSSEASGPAADRVEYREGFFLWSDELWAKINTRNNRQSYQDGLFRLELPTFDEVSVREALLNAVAHRDYRMGGSVFVRQFEQRLEIVSPGGLPSGVTPENILEQQNPRNRRLAEALGKCGLIERSGQGMNLMYESAIKQGKALPSLDGTSPDAVRLTLSGTLNSPDFVRFIERLGAERTRSFSTYDFLVLDTLRREADLPPSLRPHIPALVAAGAVESVGTGRGARYMLARGLYAALGKKGTYTRTKGLDRETNKTLLLKHIRENSKAGAPMEEFRQVLPALKRSQIQVLLRELRAQGAIHMTGSTRAARWFAGPGPDAPLIGAEIQ
ncbi:MAG: ATP-binding protein [Gemmatimonas sp.]|jgi:ATP-dependent DNA helicase RecG|uniref:ATP-binding protein n=1 Tax=Gemmatimonas sp. TaxID=1962908 RepID=UPI00391EFB46